MASGLPCRPWPGWPLPRSRSAPDASAPDDWARQFETRISWWWRSALVGSAATRKVDRHDLGALVQQLEEGVLPVGAGLSPQDRARSPRRHARAVHVDVLAVALHVELLKIGREAAEALVVGNHGLGSEAPGVAVPARRADPSASGMFDSIGASTEMRASISKPPREKLLETLRADLRSPPSEADARTRSEYRPPTQSQNPNTRSSLMPNLSRRGRAWSTRPRNGAARPPRRAPPRSRRGPSARWSWSPERRERLRRRR